MGFIKCENGIADEEFHLLSDFLKIIDMQVEQRNRAFSLTKDECVLDSIEYYVGFGFIAIQRYFHSTYPQVTPDKKKDALKVCPNGLMIILNAAADFAKHSEEIPHYRELNKQEQKTIDCFLGDDELGWHPCANKLFALTGSLSFASLLPKIEEWRNSLAFTCEKA